MTNKELFEMFVYDYDLNNPQNKEDLDKYQEVIEKLKKSMEILDLIKARYAGSNKLYCVGKPIETILHFRDDDGKIEEWIKNDKNM